MKYKLFDRGRLIGEFLQDEICGPLGVEAYIGVPETKLNMCTDLKAWGMGKVLAQSLIPSSMGRKIEPNFKDFLKVNDCTIRFFQ